MANDLNLCQFIGRLGRDPESRYTTNQTMVCNFSIAVGESWTDKASGEKKEKAEWVNVVAFDKLAEIIVKYCKKGQQVYIGGKMRTRKWQDKEGQDRYTTEIVADRMQLLGGKREDDGQQERPASDAPAPTAAADFDDDIPF